MSMAKILLIDDEASFLEVLSKRLETRNLTIATALSGEAGLKILAKDHAVDVVILDVKMPGLDGIETLQMIKKNFPLVEVVMLTGHATVETAIEGMKLGAFDYLMKPCDIDLLVQKVQEAKEKKIKHEEKIVQAQMKEITGRMA
ncbi:MAG TPA: two-component system response regulator [Desulfovibrio sp.]|nr:two-component system response regulator [Desulfovibrio sp.]HBR06893.1 two-component system response regulator [Desulfovibrio sp.]